MLLVVLAPHALGQTKNPAEGLLNDWASGSAGESIGNAVGETVNFLHTWAETCQSITQRVVRTRALFRAALLSGKGVEVAREELEKALSQKDALLVYAGTISMWKLDESFMKATSGIDNGVHPRARNEWAVWMEAMNGEVQNSRPSQLQGFLATARALSGGLKRAVTETARERKDYVRARSWAELEDSGVQFSWQTDPAAHAVMLFERYGPSESHAAAISRYQEVVALFGEKSTVAAAERMRTAARGPSGLLADSVQLSPAISESRLDLALLELIAATDGATFAKYLVWKKAGENRETGTADFQRLVLAYGPDVVAKAGEKIASIHGERLRLERSLLNNPRAVGALHRVPHRAFEDVLNLHSTAPGFLRALAVLKHGFDTEAPAKAAIDQLYAKHGEARVLETVEQLRKFLTGAAGSIPGVSAEQWKAVTAGKVENASFHWDILNRLLAGEPLVDIKETRVPMTDNPEYTVWAPYDVGTELVVRRESFRRERARQQQPPPDVRETTYRLIKTGESMVWESVTRSGKAGETKSENIVIGTHRPADGEEIPWKSKLTEMPWREMPDVIETARETLEVAGQKMECEKFVSLKNGAKTSYWLSAAIPGRFVSMRSGEDSSETYGENISLISFKSVPNPRPPAGAASPDLRATHPVPAAYKDAEFASWASFAPGTAVTIEHKPTRNGPPSGRQTFKLVKVGDQHLQFRKIGSYDGAAKKADTKSEAVIGARSSMNRRFHSESWRSCLGDEIFFRPDPDRAVLEGKETIEISGRKYACERYVDNQPQMRMKVTSWFSDQMPGRFVRQVEEKGVSAFTSAHVSEWRVVAVEFDRKDEKEPQNEIPADDKPQMAEAVANVTPPPVEVVRVSPNAPVAPVEIAPPAKRTEYAAWSGFGVGTTLSFLEQKEQTNASTKRREILERRIVCRLDSITDEAIGISISEVAVSKVGESNPSIFKRRLMAEGAADATPPTGPSVSLPDWPLGASESNRRPVKRTLKVGSRTLLCEVLIEKGDRSRSAQKALYKCSDVPGHFVGIEENGDAWKRTVVLQSMEIVPLSK